MPGRLKKGWSAGWLGWRGRAASAAGPQRQRGRPGPGRRLESQGRGGERCCCCNALPFYTRTGTTAGGKRSRGGLMWCGGWVGRPARRPHGLGCAAPRGDRFALHTHTSCPPTLLRFALHTHTSHPPTLLRPFSPPPIRKAEHGGGGSRLTGTGPGAGTRSLRRWAGTQSSSESDDGGCSRRRSTLLSSSCWCRPRSPRNPPLPCASPVLLQQRGPTLG